MSKNRIFPALFKLAVLFGVLCLVGTPLLALGAYPDKPIKVIVGFTPGGTTDMVARTVAQGMSERLGQPFVVENRPGANGNVATDIVMRSPPDGYTIFFTSVGHAVNPSLYKSAKYDPVKDFTPIGQVLSAPNVLVIAGNSPFKDLKELIAFAKAHPGKLDVASSGHGSSVHLSAEVFMKDAGVDLTHIPYKGTSVAIPDVMAGTVTMMFPNLPTMLPLIENGKLRALGVTTSVRSQVAPEIPTIAEAGVPGYNVGTWYGFIGPAKMDAAVVTRLNTSLNAVLTDPVISAKLRGQGIDLVFGTPEAFGAMIQSETDRWSKLIQNSNIKVE
jgi:tripartite-type tricarboxylate transporter receptor subunit TctC